MSLETHLKELERKHQELDAKITTEQRHPGVDDLKIKALKRTKLRLKDEIERVRAQAA